MKLLISVSILCLFMVACQKDELPTANGLRLSKVYRNWHDSISITYFYYDDQERLIRTLDTNNNFHSMHTAYFYNTDGKLTKTDVISRWTNGSTVITTGSYTDSFLYAGNKLVHKAAIVPGGYKIKNTYSYDAHARLILDSFYSNYALNELYQYNSFTYDVNDNVIEWKTFSNSFGSWQPHAPVYNLFNTSLNPYYVMGVVYYVTRLDPSSLSRHLITQETSSGYTSNYTYAYYSNGLPRRILSGDEVIEMFYE